MTWKELRETGKPFVVLLTDNVERIYYPFEGVVVVEKNGVIGKHLLVGRDWFDGGVNGTVIDYFENEDNVAGISLCTCDFYSVVLTVGCRCGGR